MGSVLTFARFHTLSLFLRFINIWMRVAAYQCSVSEYSLILL
jgi:hypothetical protein